MASVTYVVSKTKQPYGGYLPMKSFNKEIFEDDYTLNENENIHASLVGLAVDYLTRFALGDSIDEAFRISFIGASAIGMLKKANKLKSQIIGLDDLSIVSACKLAGFDVCYRSSVSAYKPIEKINPDLPTIENIRVMVCRSIVFWGRFGPVVCSEPTFEGGYTPTVNAGDGDFLSQDTLWDFKVSKTSPTTKHTLQILMYYIMGMHSMHIHFKRIKNLGFFNPRLNIAYVCSISSIPVETIVDIENNILCYGKQSCVEQEVLSREGLLENISEEISVKEICEQMGVKKSTIYADIRLGKLKAYKKGNKYYANKRDAFNYIEQVQRQQQIANGIAIVCAIFIVLLFLLYLAELM